MSNSSVTPNQHDELQLIDSSDVDFETVEYVEYVDGDDFDSEQDGLMASRSPAHADPTSIAPSRGDNRPSRGALLRPENHEHVPQQILDSFRTFLDQIHGTTPGKRFARVNPDSVFIMWDGRELILRDVHDGPKRIVAPSGSTGDLALMRAMWEKLPNEGRKEIEAVNAEIGRILTAPSPKGAPDESWLIKWRGYAQTFSDLETRRNELDAGGHLIEGLLPRGAQVLLVADSGLGKSPFSYQECLALAHQVPFLGRPTKLRPGGTGLILYLDGENGIDDMLRLRDQLCRHLGVESGNPPGLRIVSLNDIPAEFGTRGRGVMDLVRESRPELVIVDSLTAFFSDADAKTGTIARLLSEARKVSSETQTTFQWVHHPRKESQDSDREPPSLLGDNWRKWFDEVRGAKALVNGTDARIGLQAAPRGSAYSFVMRGFRRVQGEIPVAYIKRERNKEKGSYGYVELAGAAMLERVDPNPGENGALGEYQRVYNALGEEFTTGDAKAALGKSDEATNTFLGHLQELGLATKKARGKFAKIEATPGESGGVTETT